MDIEDGTSTPHKRLQAARRQLPPAARWSYLKRRRRPEPATVGEDLAAALCVAILDGASIDTSEIACQDQRLIVELLQHLNRAAHHALMQELGQDEVVMLSRLDHALAHAKANKPPLRDADQASTGRLRRSTDTARIVAALTGQQRTVSRAASDYGRRLGDRTDG